MIGAAEAALAIEGDESARQSLAGIDLQLRIERGADRKAALQQLLLAIELDELAAHLLGEGFGGEELGAEGSRDHFERLGLRLVRAPPR